jgi:class 3 adenylate cyclase
MQIQIKGAAMEKNARIPKANKVQDRKADMAIESFLIELDPGHCAEIKEEKQIELNTWLLEINQVNLKSFLRKAIDPSGMKSEDEVKRISVDKEVENELNKINRDDSKYKEEFCFKMYSSWIKERFEKLIDDLREIRFNDLIDLVSSILKEYYLRLHCKETEISDDKGGFNPPAPSKIFFAEVFIPILEQVSAWVVTSPQSKRTEKHTDKMDVQSLYDLFATTVLLIAKEITNSTVSILFLTPDQVFLEAARMLKSPDQNKLTDSDESSAIGKIRRTKSYKEWANKISQRLAKAQSEVSSLVSSEIPTYMLDWTKAEKFDNNGTVESINKITNGNSTAEQDVAHSGHDHSSRMGITAYIAVNYENYRKPVTVPEARRSGIEYTFDLVNLNSHEIQNHKAHLGKWDAVLWQGQHSKCQAILAVPISTKKLFIGILKVENPMSTTNDGRYSSEAEEHIRNLSCEVGSFFENYDDNKQIINHIWTAHVLSRISQRTTQLLELLERGEPLRTNFTKVIGYILTSLKLIYGAQEGVHVLSNVNIKPTGKNNPSYCHVLDSFYPEYENRVRGVLNRKGCEACEICRSFVHSSVVDHNAFENTTIVGEIISTELGSAQVRSAGDELDSSIRFMKKEGLEVWKGGLDASTFKNEVYEVNFEFIPLLTQPKLLESFTKLAQYNKRHSSDSLFTKFPLCPISFERNNSPTERATELTKLIIDHKDCQRPDKQCALCKTRKARDNSQPEFYQRRALVFRLSANPYDFGIVILFFRENDDQVKKEKLAIVNQYEKRSKDAIVTTTILNSVRILGKFLDSEYEDVKRFYIPNYRRPKVDKDVAILFADIRGYTKITKIIRMKNEFDLLETMVNEYYLKMGNIIQNYGRVHQFLGDGIMAIFGEHETDDTEGKCKTVLSSICCALAMEDTFKVISAEWLKQNRMLDAQINENIVPTLGIGINFGRVRFNYFGGRGHREYSPIGDHVNFAQRLMNLATRPYIDDDDDEATPVYPRDVDPVPGPDATTYRYGEVVVSKTAYDYLTDYLTEEARSRSLLKKGFVKSFSFEYPVYCPRKEDLDMPKIARVLGIDTKPLSGK